MRCGKYLRAGGEDKLVWPVAIPSCRFFRPGLGLSSALWGRWTKLGKVAEGGSSGCQEPLIPMKTAKIAAPGILKLTFMPVAAGEVGWTSRICGVANHPMGLPLQVEELHESISELASQKMVAARMTNCRHLGLAFHACTPGILVFSSMAQGIASDSAANGPYPAVRVTVNVPGTQNATLSRNVLDFCCGYRAGVG